jgi:hypothetical protein
MDMDLVAVLKAFGVMLAGIAGWLALAAAALDVLVRLTTPRQESLPVSARARDPRFAAAPAATRSAASASRR